MPVSMLDEAFLLERTVRRGGRIFAFAEPYCYRRGVMTAREMYRNGDIGKLLSVEATRVGREPLMTKVPKGEAYLPSTFMCSASVGPMLFATGLRPLRVIGMETPRAGFTSSKGAKHASAATELFEFDGGAVGRSFHGELSCPPRFTLTMCGETGTIEVCGDRLLHHDYSSGRRVSSDLRAERAALSGARIITRTISRTLKLRLYAVLSENCLETSIRRLARLTSGGHSTYHFPDCWRIARCLTAEGRS